MWWHPHFASQPSTFCIHLDPTTWHSGIWRGIPSWPLRLPISISRARMHTHRPELRRAGLRNQLRTPTRKAASGAIRGPACPTCHAGQAGDLCERWPEDYMQCGIRSSSVIHCCWLEFRCAAKRELPEGDRHSDPDTFFFLRSLPACPVRCARSSSSDTSRPKRRGLNPGNVDITRRSSSRNPFRPLTQGPETGADAGCGALWLAGGGVAGVNLIGPSTADGIFVSFSAAENGDLRRAASVYLSIQPAGFVPRQLRLTLVFHVKEVDGREACGSAELLSSLTQSRARMNDIESSVRGELLKSKTNHSARTSMD
ncbi:hypothetical protein QBC34DRAFT_34653 [Podospora aff. communis PSN243]|uniref:Uncharacterized protein n=1 Tax=Podospora aff. communis PSN243 TaxID=3040156 RepID=A0AAV9GWU4_9PEZI|nr:hypothetical protein QBC34DRAFT_34653 [Podospora aff. communis PSN243]